MIYDKNRLIRRIMFILFISLAALLQNTPGIFPEVFGVRAFLLLPVVVAIGMFERNAAGVMFGVFAGVLWDMSSSKDGFNALMMFAFAFACGMMINHFMRNNAISALVLTLSCTVVYICLYLLIFYVAEGVSGTVSLLVRFYIPSLIYTVVLSPLEYFLVREIYIYTDKPKRIKV